MLTTRPIRKRRALVADDSQDSVTSLKFILESNGYEVLTAADGVEALTKMRTIPQPDIAILDLMMPKLNGWKLLDEKNEDPIIAAIPTIVLSGYTELPEPTEGAIVMAKPVKTSLLLAEMSTLLGGR